MHCLYPGSTNDPKSCHVYVPEQIYALVGSYTQLNSRHWNIMQYTHGSPYVIVQIGQCAVLATTGSVTMETQNILLVIYMGALNHIKEHSIRP